MARKLLDHRMSEPISPLIDVVINALAAIFIILMIYMVVVQPRRKAEESEEVFKLASQRFEAGDFLPYPVAELVDKAGTNSRLSAIAQEYRQVEQGYPYIFVVGHANSKDDPRALDKSEAARLERNWNFAGRRAALIAKELQKHLTEQQRDRLVIVSAGEFDKRTPKEPLGQENAWVEVVFGKEWKPPSYQGR